MDCLKKMWTVFLLFLVVGLVSQTLQTKKVNCRKYIYAPICRGVAAKRALPQLKFDSSIRRNPKGEPAVIDSNADLQWRDKGLNEKGLLEVLFQKMEPYQVDYDSEDNENYIN